jgi:hypothetical protein
MHGTQMEAFRICDASDSAGCGRGERSHPQATRRSAADAAARLRSANWNLQT